MRIRVLEYSITEAVTSGGGGGVLHLLPLRLMNSLSLTAKVPQTYSTKNSRKCREISKLETEFPPARNVWSLNQPTLTLYINILIKFRLPGEWVQGGWQTNGICFNISNSHVNKQTDIK
jgi:hypothetical protein